MAVNYDENRTPTCRIQLNESVKKLTALRDEREIHRLAIDELKLVEKPKRWQGQQFRCAGKVVQLSQGDEPLAKKSVQLYEIGSLPEV